MASTPWSVLDQNRETVAGAGHHGRHADDGDVGWFGRPLLGSRRSGRAGGRPAPRGGSSRPRAPGEGWPLWLFHAAVRRPGRACRARFAPGTRRRLSRVWSLDRSTDRRPWWPPAGGLRSGPRGHREFRLASSLRPVGGFALPKNGRQKASGSTRDLVAWSRFEQDGRFAAEDLVLEAGDDGAGRDGFLGKEIGGADQDSDLRASERPGDRSKPKRARRSVRRGFRRQRRG